MLLQFTKNRYGIEKENELYDFLCQQYFEEGINLNSDKVLQRIVAQMGMDQDDALDYFTSPDATKKLFAEIQKLRKKGILGVPNFRIFIDGYNEAKPLMFSGGQSKVGFIDTVRKLVKDYQKSLKVKK